MISTPHPLRIRIYYEDTDFSGFVYHASYLRFLERGRTEMLRALDIHQRAISQGGDGLAFVVRRITVDYLKPALMDDEVDVVTRVQERRGASLVLDQTIVRGGTALVRAVVTIAAVRGGRAVRLPEALVRALEDRHPLADRRLGASRAAPRSVLVFGRGTHEGTNLMRNLTAEGQRMVEDVARRHGVGTDAVLTLLQALERGGGTQAQFSHYELGGMGQWSRGGMIMVGDMFNNGLKARVDQLCTELSDLSRTQSLFVAEQPYDSTGGGYGGTWWPSSFGSPSSSGSQNDMSYAYFPQARRLALRRGGQVTLYDTGDHRIGGVSQQQSDSQNLTFTSQYGTVRLFDLGLISNPDVRQPAPPVAPPAQNWAPMPEPSQTNWQPEPHADESDMFAKIERLHELHMKGILSEAEFSAKKKELLDRL